MDNSEQLDSVFTPNTSPDSPPPPPSATPDRDPDRNAEVALSAEEELREEMEKQLNLEEEKCSDEENGEENFRKGEEVESPENGGSNGGSEDERRHHQYPVRPEAEDCAFYIKTGTCKFGLNCRFNHPVGGQNHVFKDKVKEGEPTSEMPAQAECKYYLRTGGCKYGKACRYNHSRAKAPVLPTKTPTFPILELNFLGLPIRPGEKECPYYMCNGSCKYGANCRFNHPDPTSVGGSDPPSFGNGGSTTPRKALQSSFTSWSSPRALNGAAPYVPILFSPTQGVPPHNPEWNGYQAPVYPPPERGIHPPPTYVLNSPTGETNVYAHQQQQIVIDEFPERPGQPECAFFMKTGDCKFKSNCKFHHPKNRILKSPPCALSDKGLPLRPDQNICSHYSRYGICKFGPACKFNHPVEAVSSMVTSFVNSG